MYGDEIARGVALVTDPRAPGRARTEAATAARVRAADERLANRLREHGWTVRDPEARAALFVGPNASGDSTVWYWPDRDRQPLAMLSLHDLLHLGAPAAVRLADEREGRGRVWAALTDGLPEIAQVVR
ncbi:MAG: hypothetical protein ACRCZP_17355 [Phycicoccus sp.]